jgi:hypothetical protein
MMNDRKRKYDLLLSKREEFMRVNSQQIEDRLQKKK